MAGNAAKHMLNNQVCMDTHRDVDIVIATISMNTEQDARRMHKRREKRDNDIVTNIGVRHTLHATTSIPMALPA